MNTKSIVIANGKSLHSIAYTSANNYQR